MEFNADNMGRLIKAFCRMNPHEVIITIQSERNGIYTEPRKVHLNQDEAWAIATKLDIEKEL